MLYPREYCSVAGGFDKPITEYLPIRVSVLHSILHLTCKAGYELSCILLKYFMRSLTMLYPRGYCSVAGGFDKPITD